MCMHVHAEHRRHVAAEPRRGGEQQHGAAKQPRDRAAHRPGIATAAQPVHRGQVHHPTDDRRVSQQQVESPVEQHPGHGRRAGEVVSDRDLGGAGDPRLGRRWGAPQADGDAEGDAEQCGLGQRQPDQRCARTRIGGQGGQADPALPPAQPAEQEQGDDLGHQQPAVGGLHQIGRLDPNQRVEHAADRHRDETPQGQRRETSRGQRGVGSIGPAAHRVGQQREQSARPQRTGHQVDEQAVGGQVVGAAGRRVPGEHQRHQGQQGARQQHRRPAPSQDRKAGDGDGSGQQRRPAPGHCDVDQTGRRPHVSRGQVVEQGLPGHIGDRQRNQQCRADRPHARRRRPQPQRAVAGHVEHAVGLRCRQERREQEGPDRDNGGDLPRGPHERQAVCGHRAGIGQAGGGQRIGQRQRADARGHRTGQQADTDQHGPHRAGAHAGRGRLAGRSHGPRVWRGPRHAPAAG